MTPRGTARTVPTRELTGQRPELSDLNYRGKKERKSIKKLKSSSNKCSVPTPCGSRFKQANCNSKFTR